MYVSHQFTVWCKQLALAVIMVLVSSTIFAQNIRVTGKVVDNSGQPAIGVSVLIEEPRQAVATDLKVIFQ
jgi:hypothetical protein